MVKDGNSRRQHVLVVITGDAYRALLTQSRTGALEATELPQDMYTISLKAETVKRVAKVAFPGESFSDTLIRICAYTALQ